MGGSSWGGGGGDAGRWVTCPHVGWGGGVTGPSASPPISPQPQPLLRDRAPRGPPPAPPQTRPRHHPLRRVSGGGGRGKGGGCTPCVPPLTPDPPQAPEIRGDPLSDLGPTLPPRCPCVPPLRAPAAVLAPGAGKTPPPHKKNAGGVWGCGGVGLGCLNPISTPIPLFQKIQGEWLQGAPPKKIQGTPFTTPKAPPNLGGVLGCPPHPVTPPR